ncbi:Uncharacterised protein [uncultured archaeon]|nr:Uncharacterised protein [uncultured archaeon]
MRCMKKSVFVLVFLMALFACSTTKTTQPPTGEFRYGTEGLSMSFVANMPPARVYDNSPFIVTLLVENKGTSPVSNAYSRFYLSGFDQNIISGISTQGTSVTGDVLRGRDQYMPKGDVDTITFTGQIPVLTIEKYQPVILATACYAYSTVANPAVCLDPNPYGATSVQKVCTPGAVSLGSEGAPVAVTSVNVEPSPGTTRFTINVQNVGGGDVFDPAVLSSCSPYGPGLAFNQIDIVHLYDVSVGGISIKNSCRPLDANGNIRLANGAGAVYCEVSGLKGQNAYITPLSVELSYGYRQGISKSVEIRHVVTS